MPRFLECYPFADRRVRLVEGFAAYDGVLGDPPDTPHRGIDYVLPEGERISFTDGVRLAPGAGFNTNGLRALGFEVFSMHPGLAYRGSSDSWGKFVAVTTQPRPSHAAICRSIYAHLASINETIPQLSAASPTQRRHEGVLIDAGAYLGRAGNTGRTNRIIQLHIEILELKGDGGSWQKIDPYGIFVERASSGIYPQPGTSLKALRFHRWLNDEPPLAISRRRKP